MPYLYLVFSVFFSASSGIAGGFYNRKNDGKKGASSLYSFLCVGSVFVFWTIMFCTDAGVDIGVLPYSLLFAFFYTIAKVGFISALQTGPVLLTSLFMQLSSIGVSIWGFFFWDSEFTLLVGLGLVLVGISLWLCLYTGKTESGGERGGKISLKWLLFSLCAFAGNAGCSIVQKTQQMNFNGQYGNFLMLVATGVSALVCLVAWWKDDRSSAREICKNSWYIPVVAGGLNGLLNLFVVLLATSYLSPSLIYPVIGVGSLIVTTFFSELVFKEKMRWWQWVGVIVGMAAVALLSL